MKTINIFLLLIGGLFAFNANALFDLDAVGVYNNLTDSVSSNSPGFTFSGGSKASGGYGVLLDIGDIIGIQTGVIMNTRFLELSGTYNSKNFSVGEQLNSIQVPILLTLSPVPVLMVKAGLVYSKGSGSVITNTTDTNNAIGGNSVQTQDYSDASVRKDDLAAEAGIDARIPLAPFTHFLISADYQSSMVNMDASGETNTKYTNLQIVIGFGVGM